MTVTPLAYLPGVTTSRQSRSQSNYLRLRLAIPPRRRPRHRPPQRHHRRPHPPQRPEHRRPPTRPLHRARSPDRLPARSLKPRLAGATPELSNHHVLPTPSSPATDCRPLATSPQIGYTIRVSHATPFRSPSPAPRPQPPAGPWLPIRQPPSAGISPPPDRAPRASPAPGRPPPPPAPTALALPRPNPPTAHRAPSPTPAGTRDRHSPSPPPCPFPLSALPCSLCPSCPHSSALFPLPFLHRPPTPAKMHPAAPQEFFGKNSYCARDPRFRPPRPPPTAARLRPSALPRSSTRPSSR